MYTVYKTVCLVNNKYYIGVHKTDNPNDCYLGSGKMLRRAIAKHGQHNFRKEILFIFEEAQEAYAMEAQLITTSRVGSEQCYNIKLGGMGGFDFVNSDGTNTRRDMSNNKNGGRAYAQKYGSPGKQPNSNIGWRNRGNGFGGKTHTNETKARMSEAKRKVVGELNSQYGTFWITNGIENKKCRNNIIPDGWWKGRTLMNTQKVSGA